MARIFRNGSAGGYRRTKTPNGTPGSRYKDIYGPGNAQEFYRFLDLEIAAGRLTASDKQRRVMLGR